MVRLALLGGEPAVYLLDLVRIAQIATDEMRSVRRRVASADDGLQLPDCFFAITDRLTKRLLLIGRECIHFEPDDAC